MTSLDAAFTFECSNGGNLRMIDESLDIDSFGKADGYAFYDDLYIDASVPMTLDVSGHYDTQASVKHLTGDAVVHFSLTSREPNGTADIRLTGLQPGSWYRLEFDGILAKTAGGRAHAKANQEGVLTFLSVEVPS